MAIIPQIPVQVTLQPIPAVIDNLLQRVTFGEEFRERQTFLDPTKVVTNYFGKVHRKYKDMNTTNIEKLVRRLVQEQNPTLMALVKEETYLRDTFKNRFIQAKTPLGEVLQELQNSQESPNRKLLSKKIFKQAEKEARELTKKEVTLVLEKGQGKAVANEISRLQKRQRITFQKFSPELYINTYVSGDQENPSIASLGNGTFIVTWDSYLQDGDGYGIYGQIFNADGTKTGAEFPINTYTSNNQEWSSTTSLSNGHFVVTWMSDAQDGSLYGVYGQIFNTDGTRNGSEFQINTYTTNRQQDPSVASLGNGTFVVTWDSYLQDGDSSGVFGQIFNMDGTKNGSEFQINTYTTSSQSAPSTTSLNNGRFVVTWTSYFQDGDSYGVYGQIFNADGTKNGSEFQINTYTTSFQTNPSTTSLNNGRFVVTWNSWIQDGGGFGVYGQIFNADGTKDGSEFQVNTYTTASQKEPSVASFIDDKFIVTWEANNQDGDLYGIFGQVFNADGTKNGLEFQINTNTISAQIDSSVAVLSNNSFVVTWQSDNQDGSGWGIFGQIFKEVIPITSTITSSTSSFRSSIKTDVISGVGSQARGIALTALGWMTETIKGALGHKGE